MTGLLLVDVAAGSVLAGSGILPPEDRGDVAAGVERTVAATMSAPAIAKEPWAAALGEDTRRFELAMGGFAPYMVNPLVPFDGTHITTTDEERRSHELEHDPDRDPLRVAFFGGSVMFGIGQRDEHTIPSEFVRVAEEAGIPVTVHNYGRPAWVSWQEQLYLEQLLARGREYDLVVFLDGFNEVEIQKTLYSRDPTHIGATWIAELVDEFREQRHRPPGYLSGVEELVGAYRRNSAASRLFDMWTGRRQLMSGPAPVAAPSEEAQADAALGIYRRSVERIDALSRDHAVPVRYFWQPRASGWSAELLERLPPGVAPIDNVFEGRESEVYIDEVHTNEVGAMLIATELFRQVEPDLRALYAAS